MPFQPETPLPSQHVLDPLLLLLLRCPACAERPALQIAEKGTDALFCVVCERTYSVKNGVPYLLVDGGGEKPTSGDAA